MKLNKRVRGAMNLLRVFPVDQIQTYRRIRHMQPGEAVNLRVRELGPDAPIQCRPGTTDRTVLWDAFVNGYHLPLNPVREDGVIFDLGANVGYTVAHFARRFPQARVFGVEMDPENAEMARRNTRAFGDRVQIIEGAVWTDDGEIHYGGDTAFGFRVESVPRSESQSSNKIAPAFNIGSLCKKLGVETIEYMKMDIEGAEAHVLYKNNDWLNRVNVMNLETHTPARRTDCMRHLEGFGFECRKHPTHPWGVTAVRKQSARMAS